MSIKKDGVRAFPSAPFPIAPGPVYTWVWAVSVESGSRFLLGTFERGVDYERPRPRLDSLRCNRVGGGRHHAHLRCDLGISLPHGAVPQKLEDAIFGTSLKTYGWVYLIVGIILILCSLAVMGRSQMEPEGASITAGAIGAISAVWWMPYSRSGH